MHILLISPAKNPHIKKPKGIMMPQLALNLLEGLTPEEHDVTRVEEEIDRVDLDIECDLVGISTMTANAPRAYHLADEFRKRGRKVVMGGVHPTILPDEALVHADAVVIGEAEGVWEQVLGDFQRGRLQRKYHKPFPPLDDYVRIRHRRGTKKRLFGAVPVMTTRGCPYNCDFCCVHDIFGKKIRHVPVANVVQDIVDSEGKTILFLDDNIIGDPKYAKELFRAIKPLNIRWGGQASISFVRETEMMRLAAESGCIGLFFGLESVSKSQLLNMRKSLKEIYQVGEAIKKVRSFGIHFHASMIFGFDDDTKDIFPETLDFLHRNRVSSASLNVLTPYPGTKTYNQMHSEGRLITHDWRYYDHNTVVFKPRNMTSLELQIGRLWAVQEYTKLSATMRRFMTDYCHPFVHLAINLGSRKSIGNEINHFPQLATELYVSELEALQHSKGFPLWKVRMADLFPRKPRNQLSASKS
jgi:radical SAM superfamily enzyme YgiQ (UPF0313 family)